MKKIISTLSLIILMLISYSQKPDKTYSPESDKNKFPFENLIQMKKNSGDTIWLFHRYDINKWEDGEFTPYFKYTIDYYPESANIKNALIVQNENDTLQKINYYYDEEGRIISLNIQNYAGYYGNKWENYQKWDYFYNISGRDSLSINYVWNGYDLLWEKNESRGISYYDNGLVRIDSNSMWNGEEWIIYQGIKKELSFNEFGSVYDVKLSFYYNEWKYKTWTIYNLTNDTTGEYDSYITYYWVDGEWKKNSRAINIVIHDWQGATNTSPDYEFIEIQNWAGDHWSNMAKDSTLYDAFGSRLSYNFIWNNGEWKFNRRLNDVFNDRKLRTLITDEEYINNTWDTIWGSRYSFEYLGSIWSTMHYEEYNTVTSEWVPAYDHILSDFTYILNTPETKKYITLSDVQIIPNPAKSSILIKLNDETDGIKSVEVYDIAGRIVSEHSFEAGLRQEKLNVSALKNGTYIINVITKNGKTSKGKFIKN